MDLIIVGFPSQMKNGRPMSISKVVFAVFSNNHLKQDHQRWGYSTVIQLEKTIYLAIWKDLNKEKRKEQGNKVVRNKGRLKPNHKKGENINAKSTALKIRG